MLKTLEERKIYRFGPYTLDATAKVLLRDGEAVRLTRKVVETLLVLVDNAGQVLTKEELIAAVWPDRVVEDANLTQNIAVARRALNVERGEAGYIETFPGRGYRLLGPVSVEPEEAIAPAPTVLPPPPPRNGRSWLLPAGLATGLSLLAAVAVMLWFRNPPPPVPFRVSSLTRLSGREYQPALSRDGQRTAFIWSDQGPASGNAIWIQEPGAATPRRVTPAPGHYSSPAWAPNGQSLAYLAVDAQTTELRIADLNGGPERLVAKLPPLTYALDSRVLDWSPDGTQLAVSAGASPTQPLSLYLLSVATGERHVLTSSTGDTVGDVEPRFSPDGRTISFIRFLHRSNQELYTVPITGGAPQAITNDGRQVSGQDWLADGVSIVFASDRGGEFRLWKTTAKAGKLESTGIYSDSPMQVATARLAPSLVYATLQQDRNIWRVDLKTHAWTRVVASSGEDASPQYSPVGDRICFRSDRSGEEQLWISNADGSAPQPVTTAPARPSVGRWSPDGRSIVFNDPRSSEIFIASQDGAGWKARPLRAKGVHPVFSSDGRWIYAGSSASIVRIPVAGGAAEDIVKTRGFSLSLSADGEWLYFVRGPSETALWRARVATGAYEQVLDGLLPGCTSCWALTPRAVLYLGTQKGALDHQVLRQHDLTTHREAVVLDYPEPLSPNGSGPFSLAPGGQSLLCVRVNPSNSDLMRVEPFR